MRRIVLQCKLSVSNGERRVQRVLLAFFQMTLRYPYHALTKL